MPHTDFYVVLRRRDSGKVIDGVVRVHRGPAHYSRPDEAMIMEFYERESPTYILLSWTALYYGRNQLKHLVDRQFEDVNIHKKKGNQR